VIVPSVAGGPRLTRLLDSLADQTAEHQVIVVDNGSAGRVPRACERHAGVEILRLETNAGFSRAVNVAAEHAAGDTIVLVNDDCTCDPDFVGEIVAALDPANGVVMAAGVMRDGRDPSLIETAGIELDRTLLGFDYLNGVPVSGLDQGVPDPVAPSGAASGFHRPAFRRIGGFDEHLFAYWEDVDLGLRLWSGGARCALASRARGTHEHSATLGSGSARKNYLMGFGRGYVLRKWGVLSDPRRAAAALSRDIAVCAGQAVLDRNVEGVRGRVRGYLTASHTESYPAGLPTGAGDGALATLRRRASRRARLRRAASG
jgi:N-acetylglucosaminyl-diphospho-decaprenol L-rhamnosyltransferase